MCFSNEDGDWSASIHVDTYSRGGKPAKCSECNRVIADGEWRKHLFQQEHEECQICEYEGHTPCDPHSECDYGETWECNTCRECLLVLAAVYDLEAKEGCPEHSRQPLDGELYTELEQEQRYGENKYIPHALAMFPELAGHNLIVDLVA